MMNRIKKLLVFTRNLIRYNLKIVFMNRFIWFLAASLVFYLFIIFMRIRSGNSPDEAFIYNTLIFPGVLFLFFPTVFGIQIDKDTRILEILFGIPDYRFKVWFVRLLLTFLMSFLFVLILSWISSIGLMSIDVFTMAAQVMVPLLFIGSFAFMISTIVKSGFGTTVILIILGVGFLILAESIGNSMWNLFLNPFDSPNRMNEIVWYNLIVKNRMFLLIGTTVFMLNGLYNLQNREGFMQ
jgi:hypothetical protein